MSQWRRRSPAQRSAGGHLDEVNFWQPRARTPMKRMLLGEPIFFKLKKPTYAVVGYGFLAPPCPSVASVFGTWLPVGPDPLPSSSPLPPLGP